MDPIVFYEGLLVEVVCTVRECTKSMVDIGAMAMYLF
jgi:hypothetical protein